MEAITRHSRRTTMDLMAWVRKNCKFAADRHEWRDAPTDKQDYEDRARG